MDGSTDGNKAGKWQQQQQQNSSGSSNSENIEKLALRRRIGKREKIEFEVDDERLGRPKQPPRATGTKGDKKIAEKVKGRTRRKERK